MIDGTGKQNFYRVNSGSKIKIFQLLNKSGASTTNPASAWGRKDVTP